MYLYSMIVNMWRITAYNQDNRSIFETYTHIIIKSYISNVYESIQDFSYTYYAIQTRGDCNLTEYSPCTGVAILDEIPLGIPDETIVSVENKPNSLGLHFTACITFHRLAAVLNWNFTVLSYAYYATFRSAVQSTCTH